MIEFLFYGITPFATVILIFFIMAKGTGEKDFDILGTTMGLIGLLLMTTIGVSLTFSNIIHGCGMFSIDREIFMGDVTGFMGAILAALMFFGSTALICYILDHRNVKERHDEPVSMGAKAK